MMSGHLFRGMPVVSVPEGVLPAGAQAMVVAGDLFNGPPVPVIDWDKPVPARTPSGATLAHVRRLAQDDLDAAVYAAETRLGLPHVPTVRQERVERNQRSLRWDFLVGAMIQRPGAAVILGSIA